MKGVILDICPQAQIVDISHEDPGVGTVEMIYSREKHQVRAITDSRIFLQPISQTFHGRDIAPFAIAEGTYLIAQAYPK